MKDSKDITTADKLLSLLYSKGISYLTGVPCSFLTPLINASISSEKTRYVLASSEGEALSIASGIWLGGELAAVLCQNSGLGNMVNPLTSLNEPFQIPTLLLITWRGYPGIKDEPQHKLMGEITPGLLSLMGIRWANISSDWQQTESVLNEACEYIKTNERPFAILIQDKAIDASECSPCNLVNSKKVELTRIDALNSIIKTRQNDSILVATTGKTGRELFSLGENVNDIYCVGSMGYANALAHGISLTTNKHVYVIDGDGAALMHLGNLSSIGASAPKNFTHIILDNGAYDSTGGQATSSQYVDFVGISKSCGYKSAIKCETSLELQKALLDLDGPKLIYVPINIGSKVVGRPTTPPNQVARRLKSWLVAHKTYI